MAIKITDECINCGACEPECPNTAIYESGVGWKFSEGTALTSVEERNGIKYHPDNKQYSGKIYKNYSDGSLEHKGSYKDGKKNGVWVFYDRNGNKIDPNKENNPKEEEFFYIVTDKCTECNGFHDEPQCAAVCPVDCCIIDEDNIESEDELLDKKKWLHKE